MIKRDNNKGKREVFEIMRDKIEVMSDTFENKREIKFLIETTQEMKRGQINNTAGSCQRCFAYL
ncbi:hypothetical protein GCM10007216_07790 [Thalassobacillus devorans]|uniref:Uncharacterized protein n=1 Tax=Thalassobacillus devorans TaxID=279813 RepID=A0ABQ1NKZ6_9BACI|nr:hypothetical protein GCM10007216_07790 [Thalassobacillus devorans]